MDKIACEIRSGVYYDSIVLLQLQQFIAGLPGIIDAGVAMATPTNKEILAQSQLLLDTAKAAGADDMVIAVKAHTPEAAREALARVDSFLERSRSSGGGEYTPRSIETALAMLPQSHLVLISVPGRYAAQVAEQAIAGGQHVFLYSDNVPVAEEKRLKEKARQRGLMVMGPDCGTAIINGVGLGFANQVRRGNIGVIAASGTGLQVVTSRIHQLGAGISQAIGTGGRDLSEAIGAITAHQALALLQADHQSEVIVLISKPPAPTVAAKLLQAARAIAKPVVVNFLGYQAASGSQDNLHFVTSLDQAAIQAVKLAENTGKYAVEPITAAPFAPGQKYLRGLFSGGTIAYEALIFWQDYLDPIAANIAYGRVAPVASAALSQGHTILDLGADEFTVGRLHPMMDQETRLRRLQQEAEDPETALIFLDVVLGYGAHPNPAAELAPAIVKARKTADQAGRHLEIVAIVVGSEEDPQDMLAQEKQLQQAGARVERCLESAVAYAARQVAGLSRQSADPAWLAQPLAAINVGIKNFYDSVKSQGAAIVHVDWRPPAGGNEKLLSILQRMK